MDALVAALEGAVRLPARDARGPFLFAVDHAFPIKGAGTVLTGTVLAGAVAVGDVVELPALRQERKVKSIQVFRRPVPRAAQGDRAGVCVAGLDATLVERGLACAPGSVPALPGALALVKRIRFFRGRVPSESRVHCTVGHATVMATAVFFGARELAAAGVGGAGASPAALAAADADASAADAVDGAAERGGEGAPAAAAAAPAGGRGGASAAAAASSATLAAAVASRAAARGIPPLRYDYAPDARTGAPTTSWEWQEELMGGRVGGGGGADAGGGAAGAAGGVSGGPASGAASGATIGRAVTPGASSGSAAGGGGGAAPLPPPDVALEWQWAALLFDSPVVAPLGSIVIGSRLDGDVHANVCRMAFFGRLSEALPTGGPRDLAGLRLFRRKERAGVVDRVDAREGGGPLTVLARGLFGKDTDLAPFLGLTVHTRAGQAGVIEGSFGKSGKVRVAFARLDVADAAALGAGAGAGALPPRGATVPLPGGGPPVRAGDALFLRSRKFLFEPKEDGAPRRRVVQ